MNTRPLIRLEVAVGPVEDIGATQHGTRRYVPVIGGQFTGIPLKPDSSADHEFPDALVDARSTLRGVVLPGGGALLLLKPMASWNSMRGLRCRRMTVRSYWSRIAACAVAHLRSLQSSHATSWLTHQNTTFALRPCSRLRKRSTSDSIRLLRSGWAIGAQAGRPTISTKYSNEWSTLRATPVV